jgi:hypothetical protein
MTWGANSRRFRLQKLARVIRTFATDPLVVARALPGEFRQWHRSQHGSHKFPAYEVDEAWDERLHDLLGAPWPCPMGQQLDPVMADIGVLLEASGLGSGRFTYAYYSDAENYLCRAVWCVALHARPQVVIETGVAHGVTSRVVLEALSRNGSGRLWSIDLPFPFDRRLHAQTGVAVPDACRPRWTYLEGSSKQRLRPLIAETGQVDMFIHDSLHTARNTLFEMEQAASAMTAGGVMLVDDIGSHDGFTAFAWRNPGYRTIICPSADKVGIFGIAVKTTLISDSMQTLTRGYRALTGKKSVHILPETNLARTRRKEEIVYNTVLRRSRLFIGQRLALAASSGFI